MRRLASLTTVLLILSTLLSTAASARRIAPRTGTIPDDTRELRDAASDVGNANDIRQLRRFKHRPWTAGSSVALTPDETLAVVADTDNHAVVVYDLKRNVVLHRVGVGRRPERVVVSPDGLAYVTNRGSRSVSVIDPKRGAELRNVSAGVEPMGIALTPDARTLLVTSSATGKVLAFDARTLSQRFELETGEWPAAVTTHPDGKRAFVTHMYGSQVAVVDLERQRVTDTLELPSADTGLPGRLTGRFDVKRRPNLAMAAVVSPGGKRLFVAHTMVNTGEFRSAGVGVGGYGLGAPSPIVATVATFDLETNKLVRPPVKFGRGRNRGEAFNADLQVQMMSQPVALAHDPRRARLLLVGHGSDRVMALDAAASDPITRPLDVTMVGHAPEGVAITRDGTRAFVHNSQGYSLSTVTLAATRGSNRWNQTAAATHEIARNPLPEDAALGRRLFTFALDNRLSGANRFACASCHPDGRHDGLVWHVGAGPRQTPILADKTEGTQPFNWLGTETELHANIKQTIRRLGGSALKADEVAALSTYLERYMPRLDNPHRNAQDLELVATGRELFNDPEVGCSSCHAPGERFTDGQKHDVGTTSKLEFDLWEKFGKSQRRTQSKPGGPNGPSAPPQIRQLEPPTLADQAMPVQQRRIPGMMSEPIAEAPVHYNTPSLRHLWASAPYYHDGSSKTLRHLLTKGNRHDKMGKTSHLSVRQVDALEAYLKTL